MTSGTMIAEAFPPGEYLRDELGARGWTIAEFAEILGRPTQAVSEIIDGRKLQPPRRSAAHWNSSRSSRRLGLRRPVQPQHESRQVTRGAVGHPNLRGTILKCVVDFVDACHSCHGKPRAPRHPRRGSGGTGTSPRGPTPPSTLRTTRRSRTSGRRHASAAGVCERRLVLAIAR